MKNQKSIIFCCDLWKSGHFSTFMANKFERSGFEVHNLVYPTHKSDMTVEKIAKQSLQWARDIKYRSKHLTFIGHGLGGRIGLAMLDSDPVVFDAIVTIATPYKASPLVSTLCDLPKVRDIFSSMSPLSLELAKDAHLPEQLVIDSLSLSAQFDSFLAKEATSPIVDDHTTIYHSTHSSILLKDRTFFEILGWLNYSVFGSKGFGGKDLDDVVV